MRISELSIKDLPPIRRFEITPQSNVVIIAGANGSGKTRLKEAIINSFRSPNNPQASITLGATRPEEEAAWSGSTLTITKGEASPILHQYMNATTRGNTYTGTVIQIDSDRAVQQVNFQALNLATPDPDDQDINYSYFLTPFIGRWQQLVNKIYQKAANRDNKLAHFVKTSSPDKTFAEALRAHPDTFLAYQEVFAKLLPGKKLVEIDPKSPREFHYTYGNSHPLGFNTLSSGEQEVVKVTFDLVWKQLKDSVIFLDEPELHLHPTLTFRLLETLKGLGDGTNQFFLLTHSADLISTYYSTGNVFFIDSSETNDNQARQLSELTNAHTSTARAIGANLGLFAVGKKLIFIEGSNASADRAVYHRVVQATFPEAYLLPVGSVDNLSALRSIVDELGKAIFGIDLFMVRDRDGLSDDTVTQLETNQRMRCLKRRHVENYLLDAEILGAVAKAFYLPLAKCDKAGIEAALLEAASESLMSAVLMQTKENVRMYGALDGLSVKNVESLTVDSLVSQVLGDIQQSRLTLDTRFSSERVEMSIRQEHERLSNSLTNGTWKSYLQGKLILARFCGTHWGLEVSRVREAYADIAVKSKPSVFQDIAAIFRHFAELK